MSLGIVEPTLKYHPFVFWYLTVPLESGAGTLHGG